MGCVYTGIKTSRSVNGFFKIGMTQEEKPTRRWAAYDLTGLMWVYCPNATKTELFYLESVARLTCERMGMILMGNDCFHYSIDKTINKISQGMAIAQTVTQAVCEECEKLGIEFKWLKFV